MAIEQELLNRYERNIDLPAYLQSRGYSLQPSPPDHRFIQMADPTGHPIILAKSPDTGGWAYANPADPADRGTLADYLHRHEGLTPSAALTRVTACLDASRRDVPEAITYRTALSRKPEPLRRAEHEHDVVIANRGAATKALARAGLAPDSIDESRLGPIRGLADYARLTSEPLSGELWASRYKETDRRVVIAERPIDAIGSAQHRRDKDASCLAVGATLDSAQRRRLAHVLAELPPGVSVVLAFGNSAHGRDLAAQVQALAPMVKMDHAPPALPGRWGDHLQLHQRHQADLTRRAAPALGR